MSGSVCTATLFPIQKGTCGHMPDTTVENGSTTATVRTLNEKDVDEKGDPKKKICEKGFDEVIGVEFHRETHHSVERCSMQVRLL